MNLEHIFPTPIWSFEYTDTCEELIKYIQYCRKKSEGRIVSNKGGWQSEDCQASELPSCFDNLQKNILSAARGCVDEFGSTLDPWIDNVWFNINSRGNSNRPHLHAGAFLSGVFWLQAEPGSGNLVFSRNPHEDYAIHAHLGNPEMTRLAASGWEYLPKPGMCILFPGWTMHRVDDNETDSERISLAFNIKVNENF